MEYILELSKEDIKLAVYEAVSLLQPRSYTLKENFLIISSHYSLSVLFSRLAYTHNIYHVLFNGNRKLCYNQTEHYFWNKVYNHDFAVRTVGFQDEKKLAALIYSVLKKKNTNPQVNLKNSSTEIYFFKLGRTYYTTQHLWKNNKSFLLRKAHLKPVLHPTSINPKLARCVINLVVKKGVLYDPFCGVGGILVEGCFLGLSVIGNDIDTKMLDAAKTNVEYYALNYKNLNYKSPFNSNYKLLHGDATKTKVTCEAIVTDLPYGKNTKNIDAEPLYLNFLKHAYSLTSKAVVMFPDFVNFKKIIRKTKWKIDKVFTYYLHKGLSKKIVILKKKGLCRKCSF